MRRPALLAVAMALVALVLGPACAGGGGAPLPAGPPVVEVTMLENRFEYDPNVPAGRVVFRVRNVGHVDHRLTLVPLTEDIPPIDVQVRGTERRPLTPFAGIPTRAPGATGTFAVDLEPGVRYGMVCFVRDPDGQTHAQKGMSSEFRTPGAPAPGPAAPGPGSP